jgi:receptor protein-tyrosine kinase/non-specific protein-tyrosine kinase
MGSGKYELCPQSRSEAPRYDVREFRQFTPEPTASARLIALADKGSVGSEKFRILCTQLRSRRRNGDLKVVAVTSSLPQEGKSLVASNAAVTMAFGDKQRVLLIDGDLRRPVLAKAFGLRQGPGLVEWLRGESSASDSIYQANSSGFHLCPASGGRDNPIDFLPSAPITERLGEVSKLFDWIIIDCPPMLPLADAALWLRVSDGALIVARAECTPRALLAKTLESIKDDKFLGVVFNDFESNTHTYYKKYYSPHSS